MCKDKEKKVDFRMQFLDFLQQKFIVFQSSSVPLPKLRDTCIFFAEKAKKDTASIGARLEVLVFRRGFCWSVYAILSFRGTRNLHK
ncbi:hypothetical protein B0A72_18295 [Flavobacterium pectinovorum]|uniref:Uncharacterized protein n=1 Tax=Flavobacterium pectinovorum TaxID=29533 RepID=A0AB36NXF7_9FLAO|nr:hypothetical protein B0A72_18295 [Flavobacterium pectinovorum]